MMSKKNCLNCFFCAKCFRSPDDGLEKVFSLTSEERDALIAGDFSGVKDGGYISRYLQCHKAQWSEALSGVDVPKLRESLATKNCRFFYSSKKGEGRFFDGVEKELESHRVSLAIKTASWSLFIAALSFLISFSDKVAALIK